MSIFGNFIDNVFGSQQHLTEEEVTFRGGAVISAMPEVARSTVDYQMHAEKAKQGMSPGGQFSIEFFGLMEEHNPNLEPGQKQEAFAQAFERFNHLDPQAKDEAISNTKQLAEQFRANKDPNAKTHIRIDNIVDTILPEQGRPVGDIHKLVGEKADELSSIRAGLQSFGVSAIGGDGFNIAAQTVQGLASPTGKGGGRGA